MFYKENRQPRKIPVKLIGLVLTQSNRHYMRPQTSIARQAILTARINTFQTRFGLNTEFEHL